MAAPTISEKKPINTLTIEELLKRNKYITSSRLLFTLAPIDY
jgi:hypothetical protein